MGNDRLPKLLINWQLGMDEDVPKRSGEITWGKDWKGMVWQG